METDRESYPEAGPREVMENAVREGIQTAWERLDDQEPRCGFGTLGLCCRNCRMGPCRIDPFGDGPQEGVCGATADVIAARNLVRMIAAGTAAHSDHGRNIVYTLLLAARGKNRGYSIKDEVGQPGDFPCPVDYDGDGCADIALFRGMAGLWAIRGITRIYFGELSDRPVPGDYNGSGSAAIAIFRPSMGLWALRGISRLYFGSAGDWALPADYDGDGECEFAIFRPDAGLWAVRGLTRVYFGTRLDWPIPADFNGDGTAASAIFRRNSGLWAVCGLTRLYFGAWGDTPVAR